MKEINIEEYKFGLKDNSNYYFEFKNITLKNAKNILKTFITNYQDLEYMVKCNGYSYLNKRLTLYFLKEKEYTNLKEYIKSSRLNKNERILIIAKLCIFFSKLSSKYSQYQYKSLFFLKSYKILYNKANDTFKILFCGLESCYIEETRDFDSISKSYNLISKGNLPPELSKIRFRDSNKQLIDIFLFGKEIFKLIYGRKLNEYERIALVKFYSSNTNIDLNLSESYFIKNSQYTFIKNTNHELNQIICKCIEDNPSERYTSWEKLKENILEYFNLKYDTKYICKCFNFAKFYCPKCNIKYCNYCVNQGNCPIGHYLIYEFDEIRQINEEIICEIKDKTKQSFKNFNFQSTILKKGLDFIEKSRENISNLLKDVLNFHDDVLKNLRSIEHTFTTINKLTQEFESKINNDFEKINQIPNILYKSLNLTNQYSYNIDEGKINKSVLDDFDKIIEKNKELSQINFNLEYFMKSCEKINYFKTNCEQKINDFVDISKHPINFMFETIENNYEEFTKNFIVYKFLI